MRVHLCLGSNIDPEINLPLGCQRLRAVGRVVAVSRVYRSPPADGARGGAFLNAAVTLETEWEPGALRVRLHALEEQLGRVRPAPSNAPRTIDFDLILCPGRDPHPDLLRHAHVALPLAELVPDARHPQTSETVRRIAERLAAGLSLECVPDVVLRVDDGGASPACA